MILLKLVPVLHSNDPINTNSYYWLIQPIPMGYSNANTTAITNIH